jgi:DNA-binding transcriptional LysR family regulator
MDLKQLEALYWVGRLGGFHAAARHLKTAQPTLSARVRELEEDLGVGLFNRSGRQAVLTPKGRELVAYAEQMLRLASDIRQRVGTRHKLSGRVRLGVTSVPAATWLPTLVRRLAHAYPSIALEFMVETSEALRQHLLDGLLDVAIVSAGLPLPPALRAQPVGQVELAWLAAPSLGLPTGTVGPRTLASSPVISDVPGSQLRAIADAWFSSAGTEPHRHHACPNLISRIRLACEGVGVALATPAAAVRELGEGALRVLPADPPLPPLDYVLASTAPGVAPAAVSVVTTLALELLAERPGMQFFYSEAAGRHELA